LSGIDWRLQIKHYFSACCARDADRQKLGTLRILEHSVSMVDLAREIARATRSTTAIGAVEWDFITILI
jgi:hypothetical protein